MPLDWGRIFTTGLTIMGSYFRLITRMVSHIIGFWGLRQVFIFTVSKRTKMFVLPMKSKVFFIQCKKWVNS